LILSPAVPAPWHKRFDVTVPKVEAFAKISRKILSLCPHDKRVRQR